MRNVLCYLGFLASVLLIVGCVQVEQTLTLNADGSGSLAVSYGMSKEDVAQMEAMSREAFEAEGMTNDPEAYAMFDFDEDDIRADFKAYEQHGVTLQSVKTAESNGWKYVHLNVKFKSLEGLSRTEFISDRTISLVRDEEGHYLFRQAAAQTPAEEEAAGKEQDDVAAAMADLMKGFRAVMIVRAPSKILSSNAGASDETSATWEFDLAKDPNALERAQKLDMQVRFDGTGLSLPEFKPAGGG